MAGLSRKSREGPIGPSPSAGTWSYLPAANAFRSAPAQNVPPSPQRTATLASGSASKARKASASARAVSGSTAFRASGRLRMTVVTGPCFSTRTLMGRSLERARHRIERDRRSMDRRRDPHGVVHLVLRQAPFQHHLLVRSQAGLAAVDGADRQREQLEIGLVRGGPGETVHAQPRRLLRIARLSDQVAEPVVD